MLSLPPPPTLFPYTTLFRSLTAVLGMYWDISLHIDNGRDDGPLANPAHFLILIGLYGVLLAGVLSAALAKDRDRKSTRLNSSHLVISYAVFCLKKIIFNVIY